MDAQALIIWLIVGGVAGWLAGMVVKGGGYGLIGDIIVGILGGLIAGWLLPQLGIVIGAGFVAAIINAFIGAVMCPACLCGGEAAGHNALRGSGPNR